MDPELLLCNKYSLLPIHHLGTIWLHNGPLMVRPGAQARQSTNRSPSTGGGVHSGGSGGPNGPAKDEEKEMTRYGPLPCVSR